MFKKYSINNLYLAYIRRLESFGRTNIGGMLSTIGIDKVYKTLVYKKNGAYKDIFHQKRVLDGKTLDDKFRMYEILSMTPVSSKRNKSLSKVKS